MRHSTPGISENARKNSKTSTIKTIFFDLQKFNISLMPLHGPILKNEFYLGELDTLKDNIGRTRISRWLGRENEENVARTRNCCGWPSSHHNGHLKVIVLRK